jgi:phage-related baseplate assembly protein
LTGVSSLLTGPHTIDVSNLPPPQAIEVLDFAALEAAFIERFLAEWERERQSRPELPVYNVERLRTDAVAFIQRGWNYLRLLDRARVNDAVRSMLPAFATGANLDHLVAKRNIARLTVIPATGTSPAVLETDAQLLRRYLVSFGVPAAGSADGYTYRAMMAFPTVHDVAINGYAVHGRRGEVDVVVAGPDGRLPTPVELNAVRAAVTAEDAKPVTSSVTVLAAARTEYAIRLHLHLVKGPDPTAVVAAARARVLTATTYLTRINQEVPIWSVAGHAYDQNVSRVEIVEGVDIPASPYRIPVCTGVTVTYEVQQ